MFTGGGQLGHGHLWGGIIIQPTTTGNSCHFNFNKGKTSPLILPPSESAHLTVPP